MKNKFTNLDETTRLNMIMELERDIESGLFYKPSSLNSFGLRLYPDILKESFRIGDCSSLERDLKPNMFKEKFENNKKVPSNSNSMLAFNDFNRYYVRAILIRAIAENKSISVYRAKKSVNERDESKLLVGKVIFQREEMEHLLSIYRDYRILFSKDTKTKLLLPNSGLSLMLSN